MLRALGRLGRSTVENDVAVAAIQNAGFLFVRVAQFDPQLLRHPDAAPVAAVAHSPERDHVPFLDHIVQFAQIVFAAIGRHEICEHRIAVESLVASVRR